MKLLTIGNIWYGLGEVSRQHLTEAPRVMKRMKVDKEFVVGGMGQRPLDFCCGLTVCVTDRVTAVPAFTVMLSVEYE